MLGVSGSLPVLYAVQALHTVLLAVVLGLGPLFLVRTLSVSRDVAASVFFAGQGSARIAAGGLSAVAVGSLGLPHLLLLPAVGIAVVLVVVLVSTRGEPAPAGSAPR